MKKQYLVTVEFDGPGDAAPEALNEKIASQFSSFLSAWDLVAGERWYWEVTAAEPVEDTKDEGEE